MDNRTKMTEELIFGSTEPNVLYTERRAAYLVVTHDGLIAMIKSQHKHFLPGGGSLPGEAPENTVVREVHEELAQGVRLLSRIGEATQYFYSSTDDRHYKMLATFFVGKLLTVEYSGKGEHELDWLPTAEALRSCFHECHAWAIRQSQYRFV